MFLAVLVNDKGQTTSFEKDGTVRLYIKTDDGWELQKEKAYSCEGLENAEGFRKSLLEIIRWMPGCDLVVVNRIRGVQYLAFEEHKISMLEIPGRPEDFIQDIHLCETHERTEDAIPLEHVAIYEQTPDHYYSDLRDVMNGKTSYNSKQILLPFFKNANFKSLEILCEHVPKWFEKELPELHLIFTAENFKNGVKIKVFPR